MKTAQKLREQGFTLIELLVVIAVLGILAAVVLVAVDPSTRLKEARDSGVKSDVGQLAQSLEAYYSNANRGNGTYPTALSDLVGAGKELKVLPAPPDGRTVKCDSSSASDQYEYSASGGEAVIYCQLENPKDPAAPLYCYRTATRKSAELSSTTCIP